MHPGGSPLNVAIGLARLGHPTAFAGKISTDLFGRHLHEYVEGEEIDTRFLLSSDAQSTLAFVAMEEGEAAYAFYNEGTADTLLTSDDVPPALFTETAILHVGSISLLRGTTPDAVLATVERLKGRASATCLISFDPNVRPGLVRGESAYRAMLDRLFDMADVVKLSSSDLAWLAPGRPINEVGAELLDRGAMLVAITQGKRGVLALSEGKVREISAFDVPVVDTVGAGDAFSSGLLAGLAERGINSRAALQEASRDDIERALRLASAVSALTCTRAGADPPRRDEVAQFLEAQGAQ
jgi:fructokinase